MAPKKHDKKKAKRKAKIKSRKKKLAADLNKGDIHHHLRQYQFFRDIGRDEKAADSLLNAQRLDPKNATILAELTDLGYNLKRDDLFLKGLHGLYRIGNLKNEHSRPLCLLLEKRGRFREALQIADKTLAQLAERKTREQRNLQSDLMVLRANYLKILKKEGKQHAAKSRPQKSVSPGSAKGPAAAPPKPLAAPISKNAKREKVPDSGPLSKGAKREKIPALDPVPKKAKGEKIPGPDSLPEIPVTFQVDSASFKAALTRGEFSTRERYELALDGWRILFKESFESLICLNTLKGVRSLWHQEETARKVLKSFRGRALLSDEVGLGKTIEALIVFKEYIRRGMVKTGLILTPTPLVSQWKQEMKAKFDLDVPSTDDEDFQTGGNGLWDKPFIPPGRWSSS